MVMGRYEMLISTLAGLDFMAWMPIAASVPNTVATSAANTAMDTVVLSASIIWRERNSSSYHLRLNPPQRALVLEALKEYTFMTTMGAYRKISISDR